MALGAVVQFLAGLQFTHTVDAGQVGVAVFVFGAAFLAGIFFALSSGLEKKIRIEHHTRIISWLNIFIYVNLF